MLDEVIAQRGKRLAIRCDNGPALTTVTSWLARWLACCLPRAEESQERCYERRDSGLDHRSYKFVYWVHMSETRDKRRRTDLDLFVLALIDSDLDSLPTPERGWAFSRGNDSSPPEIRSSV